MKSSFQIFRAMFLAGAAALTLISCSQNDSISDSGGNTAETGNPAIYGRILKPDGTPASNTRVRAVPQTFNPFTDGPLADSLSDITDNNGAYSIPVQKKTVYNIEAMHIKQQTRVLISGVIVFEDSIALEAGTLAVPGRVILPVPAGIDTMVGTIYIPGSTFLRDVSTSERFIMLDSLPPGYIPVVIFVSSADASSSVILKEHFEIHADSTNQMASDNTLPRIEGRIVYTGGLPVVKGRIVLLPPDADFSNLENDSAFSWAQAYSISDGSFEFRNAPAGRYNLEFSYSSEGIGGLLRNIEVLPGDSIISTPTHTLLPWSTVHITLPDSFAVAGAVVYIPGTQVYTPVNPAAANPASIFLAQVPAEGMFDIHIRLPDGSSPLMVKAVQPVPGDTLHFGIFQAWNHSAKISLNTSPSGADVAEDVVDFPLLVRLSGAVFDFSQAGPGGRDLRFASADSTPFPFEIEHWDSAGASAAIWIKLDRIFGSAVNQYIRMFWGNEEAPPASSSRDVFDTANGFRGVWHLSETGNRDPAGYRDATATGAHGTGVGLREAASVPGISGNAQHFNGISDYITISKEDKFNFSTSLSLSTWVQVDTFSVEFQTIIAKGDSAWRLQRDTLNAGLEFSCDQDSFRHVSGGISVNDGGWHLVSGVFDNQTLSLYIDGVLDSSLAAAGAMNSSAEALWIGNNPGLQKNNRFFHGTLDEIRVSDAIRPEAWIKLSYRNQMQNSQLLDIVPE